MEPLIVEWLRAGRAANFTGKPVELGGSSWPAEAAPAYEEDLIPVGRDQVRVRVWMDGIPSPAPHRVLVVEDRVRSALPRRTDLVSLRGHQIVVNGQGPERPWSLDVDGRGGESCARIEELPIASWEAMGEDYVLTLRLHGVAWAHREVPSTAWYWVDSRRDEYDISRVLRTLEKPEVGEWIGDGGKYAVIVEEVEGIFIARLR